VVVLGVVPGLMVCDEVVVAAALDEELCLKCIRMFYEKIQIKLICIFFK
jgi:hypothetical protein